MDTETKVQEPVKEQTPEQIMTAITAAGASGNLTEVIRLGNQLKKFHADFQKAEAAKLQAESDALAGDRAKLTKAIYKAVGLEFKTELLAVKATGYTLKLDKLADDGSVEMMGTVALTVPTVKARTGGGGGGSTGALKQQTGLSRHELVETYATDEEKQSIADAEAGATSRPDSARYSAEKPVIKRILADNPNLIKS